MAGRHDSRSTKEWVEYGLQRYVMCMNYSKNTAFSLDVFPHPGHIREFMRVHEICDQIAKRFGGISYFSVRDYENSSMNLDFGLHNTQFPIASFKKIQIAIAKSQAKTRFMCAVCGAKARPSERFAIDGDMVPLCSAHAAAADVEELENPSTTIDEAAESLFLRIVRRDGSDAPQDAIEHDSHERHRQNERGQQSAVIYPFCPARREAASLDHKES